MKYFQRIRRDVLGRIVYNETKTVDEQDERHIIEEQEPLFNLLRDRQPVRTSGAWHLLIGLVWILATSAALSFAAVGIYHVIVPPVEVKQ